jgi:hypothetical protein
LPEKLLKDTDTGGFLKRRFGQRAVPVDFYGHQLDGKF